MTEPGPAYLAASLAFLASTLLSAFTDGWATPVALLVLGLVLGGFGVRIHLRGRQR